ncbi:MAG: sigma-54 dependent transcriptional regulator [Desulfovermiculus sp.]
MQHTKPTVIGSSPATRKVYEMVEKVSNVDLNVLITGESGVGKELVARTLHAQSNRNSAPFIKVNCAAMPSDLLESELFGYEKGAFTGADKSKAGKFEIAKSGTIFLDEIGELPNFMQAKLLQVLQDRSFYRVGGHQETMVHARIIAATNIDFTKMINNGSFRNDLFHRLSTITIHIPPLRERRDDILPLTEHFIHKTAQTYNLSPIQLNMHLMNIFYHHSWPGNIRELENYIKQLSILENYTEIEQEIRALHENAGVAENWPSGETAHNQDPASDVCNNSLAHIQDMIKTGRFSSMRDIRDSIVKEVEKQIIDQTLDGTDWNRKEASRVLGLSYRSLLYKIKEYGLSPHNRGPQKKSRNFMWTQSLQA